MEIEFAGSYDQSTYFKAIRWVYQPSRGGLVMRAAIFLAFLVLYGIFLFNEIGGESTSAWDIARGLRHLVTGLGLLFILLQPYLRAHQTASRFWRDPVTRRNITGQISSLGIQINPANTWIPWDQFIRKFSSPDLIILFTISRSFIILPRTFFKSDRDWAVLEQWIKERVKEAQ